MLDWEEIAIAYVSPAALQIMRLLSEAEEEGLSPSAATPLVQEVMAEQSLGSVAYHFRELAKRGLIRELRTEPRRGALEHFYGLSAVAQTVA